VKVGYARTSTIEQIAGLEAQERELQTAGVEKIFSERVSSSVAGRNLRRRWNPFLMQYLKIDHQPISTSSNGPV
jgi:DNA invertase Pin-like site-specific DNA recombinase